MLYLGPNLPTSENMCERDLSFQMNPAYLVDIFRMAYDMSRVEHEDWQQDFIPGPLPDEITRELIKLHPNSIGIGCGTVLGRGVYLNLFFTSNGDMLMHRHWKNHSPSQVNRLALAFGIFGD